MKTLSIIILIILLTLTIIILWASSNIIAKTQYELGRLEKTKYTQTEKRSKKIKIISANLAFCGGINGLKGISTNAKENGVKIRQWISKIPSDIDILLVQEIDEKSKRSGYVDQINEIAKELEFQYYAVGYTWNKKWVPHPINKKLKEQFGPTLAGQVIFSRYPIIFHKIQRFKKPKSLSFLKKLFYLDRITQHISIEHPNIGIIKLSNVHLEAFDKRHTVHQLNETLEYRLNKKVEKTIITGDFNIDFSKKLPENLDIKKFKKFKEIGSQNAKQKTYPSINPKQLLDTFIISRDWKVIEVKTLGSKIYSKGEITDHLPIYAILEYKKGEEYE